MVTADLVIVRAKNGNGLFGERGREALRIRGAPGRGRDAYAEWREGSEEEEEEEESLRRAEVRDIRAARNPPLLNWRKFFF